MHNINLVVGDWSKDGHNQSESVTIRTNLKLQEVQAAYNKGVKKIGFDLLKNCCHDYEDNVIQPQFVEKLKSSGYKFDENDDLDDEEGWFVDTDIWVELYLFFVKTGNPDFEHEIISDNESIKLGGYGLFFT
jgi:hypothetical protein